MTVEELRQIIKDLPGDMIVAAYDVGGYLAWEFTGADVVTERDQNTPGDLEPPYLRIGSA